MPSKDEIISLILEIMARHNLTPADLEEPDTPVHIRDSAEGSSLLAVELPN